MGVVYEAKHEATGEIAALKTVMVPRPELLSGLRREIHALSRIRHPGIVRILHHDVREGVPWYAMELLARETLRRRLADPDGLRAREARATTLGFLAPTIVLARDGASRDGGDTLSWPAQGLPVASALTLARRLCAPLAFLHGEGFVHRDLKPENVFVLSGDQPVVMDLGLATTFLDPSGREAMEPAGVGVGTALYVAPEQVRGELVDARADIYALGCILYEMLTGEPPFAREASVGSILRAHLIEAPVPPSARRPELPPELDALVLRLLEKRPRDRPGHAADVARTLERLGARNGQHGPPARSYLYRSLFVGREAHLQRLRDRLQKSDRGSILLVGGVSGVGKTRLMAELAGTLRGEGGVVLRGATVPSGGIEGRPLHVLAPCLEAIADRCRAGGPEEAERILAYRASTLAAYHPALASFAGSEPVSDPKLLPPEIARVRLFAHLVETLHALGREKRLVLLIDDLQWADDLTLGFIEHLARCAAPIAFDLVAAYRTEEAREGMARLLACPSVLDVRLGRLDDSAVRGIIGDMMALGEVPEPFADHVAAQAEGNPLFVGELLRGAVEEGLVRRDEDGRWMIPDCASLDRLPERLPLPAAVALLLHRRFEGLSPDAREVAGAASVLGRVVDGGCLADVVPLPDDSMLVATRELITRNVLEDAGAGQLRFCHDKIREALYDAIEPERRRAWHGAAAAWMERALPAEGDHLSALAEHYERAGHHAEARAAYLAAARRAAASHAYREQERLLGKALALADCSDAEMLAARIDLGLVRHVFGATADACREVDRALRDACAIGEQAIEARALRGLGFIHHYAGRPEEARRCYERALSIAEALGEQGLTGLVLDGLANLLAQQGEDAQAMTHYERAASCFREQQDLASEARILGNMALLLQQRGRLPEAEAVLERAIDGMERTGDRRSEGVAIALLGAIRAQQGRLGEAESLFERALQIHRRLGDRRNEGIALGNIGNIAADRGEMERAAALYESALAIHREVEDVRFEAIALCNLAELHFDCGRYVEADACADRAQTLAREATDLAQEQKAVSILGSIDLARGRLTEARACLERALALARELENRMEESRAHVELASIFRIQGKLDAALSSLARAGEALSGLAAPRALVWYACERGHLELACGGTGRRLLDEAEARAASMIPSPPSPLRRAIAMLRRAVEAKAEGRRVVSGQCPEDLPEGWRGPAEGQRP